jgi:microcystin-dependent protein
LPALTETTTFILDVAAQQGGQTVKLYFSVTVVVANPDITAKNLTVLDMSTLQGPVSVEATLSVAGAISGFGTVPVGCVIPYGGDALGNASALQTQGWLFCDGSAVSRTTYATLFSVIGTWQGAGDGSTKFNLPDYRGRFQRGTDHGTGRDPDIALRVAANPGGATGDNTGSVQPWATGKPANIALTTDVQGNHNHTVSHVPNDNSSYRIAGSSLAKWTNDSATTSTAGAHSHTVNSGGDNETRPINAYVAYLIRFQ